MEVTYRIKIPPESYVDFWKHLGTLFNEDDEITFTDIDNMHLLDDWVVETIPLISESTLFRNSINTAYIEFKTEEDMTMFMLEWK